MGRDGVKKKLRTVKGSAAKSSIEKAADWGRQSCGVSIWDAKWERKNERQREREGGRERKRQREKGTERERGRGRESKE